MDQTAPSFPQAVWGLQGLFSRCPWIFSTVTNDSSPHVNCDTVNATILLICHSPRLGGAALWEMSPTAFQGSGDKSFVRIPLCGWEGRVGVFLACASAVLSCTSARLSALPTCLYTTSKLALFHFSCGCRTYTDSCTNLCVKHKQRVDNAPATESPKFL